MHSLQDVVPFPVNSSSFLLSIRTPKHEDKAFLVVAEPLHHSVSERFPAFVFVGVGLVCSDGQHGIEEQHTLLGPSSQISMSRVLKAFNVRDQFFVHVLQTGWGSYWSFDTKAQTMGLVRTMIRILAQNHHLDIPDVAHLCPGEDMLSRWVHGVAFSLIGNKTHQLFKVGLSKLRRQRFPPAFRKSWRCLCGGQFLERCSLVAGDLV